jgi:hypothetical protein
VAPRFRPADPASRYTDSLGYGWLGDGERQAHALARDPAALPSNLLFGDWISGVGAQVFRIRCADGIYSVFYLRPNGSADSERLRARGGFLDIKFPDGEWTASGLVVKGARALETPAPMRLPKKLPRPNIAHTPAKTAPANQALAVVLRILPVTGVRAVRLHYRPANQPAKFRTLENAGAKGLFTIPAAELAARGDLVYYFEILNQENAGWFDPDPRSATPYYVVRVE